MAISSCISLSNTASPFNIDETGTHGTPDFPVAIYRDDVTECFVNWHWHAEIEIGYVEEGSIILECGNRKYALSKGDIFFINTNVLHAMSNQSKTGASVFRSIAFDSSVISSNTKSIFYQKYLHPVIHNNNFRDYVWHTGSQSYHALSPIIQTCWDVIFEEKNDYEITTRNLLSDFFAALIHTEEFSISSNHIANSQLENRVQLILNYIHTNYANKISLKDLAAVANVSKNEVLRCFKAIINTSPIKYIKDYRLQTAAYMLKNNSYEIQTICELCGFESNSYFSKSFKELYNCSPSEYREQIM